MTPNPFCGPSGRAAFADCFDLVVFDLDGVLYRGSEPLPNAAGIVARLKAEGKRTRYLTNNSVGTPEGYAAKLNRMGVGAAPEEIFTSSRIARRYLEESEEGRTGVTLAIGEEGLLNALRGLRVVDETWTGRVDFVVVGQDRNFHFRKLLAAHRAILRGAKFIATNRDFNFPAEGGEILPGAGAVVASIETSTQAPSLVMGKPEARGLEMICREAGVEPSRALVVGDRLETDIAAARAAGAPGALVLTGIATRRDAERAAETEAPALIVEDLFQLESAIFPKAEKEA